MTAKIIGADRLELTNFLEIVIGHFLQRGKAGIAAFTTILLDSKKRLVGIEIAGKLAVAEDFPANRMHKK